MVFDPRTENTLVIAGADFFLTVMGNPLPQEDGNVIRLYGKDRRSDGLIIEGFLVARLFEHDVRCAFDLLDDPRVTKTKRFRNRTIAFGKDIQNLMGVFGIDTVIKLLRSPDIRDF